MRLRTLDNPLVRLARIRIERRIKGLCNEFGCKVVTGDTFRCPDHAAMNAKRVREYRARRTLIKQLARQREQTRQ